MASTKFDEIKAQVLEASGGVGELASYLGITRHAIYQWDKIPADRVGQVMTLTGLRADQIRPDLFMKQTTA